MKPNVTQNRLHELLDYSPETGLFKWKIAHSRRVHVGDVAGSTSIKGYILIGVDGFVYRAHRLVWLYVHGEFPKHYIDHINGIKTDNRIENLRDVSSKINNENQKYAPSHNKSCGVLGVSREKNHRRWRAVITIDKKQVHIGYFDTIEEAEAAYVTKKRKLHVGCTI
jgi:hypothetical protein